MSSILIVDDDDQLRQSFAKLLKEEGYAVTMAPSGEAGLEAVRNNAFDLVVLDVGLPGMDGFEVLRRVRQVSEVPVIMLTAHAEEVDRIVGLTVGADDYVTKPFSPREVIARISAVLRRTTRTVGVATDEIVKFEALVVDLARREVRRDGEVVELSALEFDLLAALASAPGRVFTREQLMERVWGWDYFGVPRLVDVHVANLRKALGDDAASPRFIGTVRGVGYKFVGAPR